MKPTPVQIVRAYFEKKGYTHIKKILDKKPFVDVSIANASDLALVPEKIEGIPIRARVSFSKR